ncbi:hypothetical protein L596_015776 [Steinernema carpocapsae]|uniref:VWFA domain-containing protein n=1 Tax=Steinernema carpocapsae TaxID=34508 RepID=A0A4U5NG53_STECR|nr:hypothetical protein L596_015776 [Steinernema carpocapsae]
MQRKTCDCCGRVRGRLRFGFRQPAEIHQSTLIDPNWTKFDDLMIAAHDDYAQFNFGEIHNLNEATGLVSHSFQSQDLPSLSRFFRSLKEKFGGEDMSLVIFSANKNPAEIQSAFPAYRLIADSMNVVMVGMPGAASNLNILGQTYVPWANPGDSSGYGDLKNKIMAGTKLNCTCVPPTATTTTSVGPGKSTTTGPTGPTPTGPTPTGPTVTPTPCTNPGSPCNQKFFVIFDTSTDISRANYANQQNFITTSLIEPSWTNFDQFNLWSYNKYVTDNGFTEYHQRSDVVGAIRNTNQSNVYVPNIRRLYESLAAKYAGVYMSVVIFSATNNTQDIKDAACFFNKLEKSTRIVMVGMPAADPSLATIAHAYVSWENLGNSAGYSAKASEIMKDTRLKCGCQGTPKPTPPQGTTATPGGSGCQPCSTPLALMMDHSIDISKETYKAQQYFLTKSFISSNWVNFDQYSFIAYDYYMDPQMFGEFKNRSDVVKEIMVPQSEDNYSSIRRLYETMIKAYGEKKMTAVIFAGTNNTKDVRAAGLLHQTLHKTMNIVIRLPRSGEEPRKSRIRRRLAESNRSRQLRRPDPLYPCGGEAQLQLPEHSDASSRIHDDYRRTPNDLHDSHF